MQTETQSRAGVDPGQVQEAIDNPIPGEQYRRHWLGLSITEGLYHVAELAKAHWLLDIVASYQMKPKFRREPFQTWKLEVKNGAGRVVATDGNGHKLVTQKIPFTDFPVAECTVWLEGRVMLLPAEH